MSNLTSLQPPPGIIISKRCLLFRTEGHNFWVFLSLAQITSLNSGELLWLPAQTEPTSELILFAAKKRRWLLLHSRICPTSANTITSQPVAVPLTSLSIMKIHFPRWGNTTVQVRAMSLLPNCHKANLPKIRCSPSLCNPFLQKWKRVSLYATCNFLYVLEKHLTHPASNLWQTKLF